MMEIIVGHQLPDGRLVLIWYKESQEQVHCVLLLCICGTKELLQHHTIAAGSYTDGRF
jgi:hypothetical protein